MKSLDEYMPEEEKIKRADKRFVAALRERDENQATEKVESALRFLKRFFSHNYLLKHKTLFEELSQVTDTEDMISWFEKFDQQKVPESKIVWGKVLFDFHREQQEEEQ